MLDDRRTNSNSFVPGLSSCSWNHGSTWSWENPAFVLPMLVVANFGCCKRPCCFSSCRNEEPCRPWYQNVLSPHRMLGLMFVMGMYDTTLNEEKLVKEAQTFLTTESVKKAIKTINYCAKVPHQALQLMLLVNALGLGKGNEEFETTAEPSWTHGFSLNAHWTPVCNRWFDLPSASCSASSTT